MPADHNLRSDEMNQLLMSARNASISGINITAGIAREALKEALGDNFPDNFDDLPLDKQEELIEGLNAAQVARFNANLTDKAQELAEIIPMSFQMVMMRSIDRGMENSEESSDEHKDLEAQREILLGAMVDQVNAYADTSNNYEMDLDNVAGVYDGLTEVLGYIEDNEQECVDKFGLNNGAVVEARRKLDDKIKEYDEYNHLEDVKEGSEDKIEKALDSLSKQDATAQFDAFISEDAELKNIFESLDFSSVSGFKDADGKDLNPDECKKIFQEFVVNSARQRAACSQEEGEDLKNKFKQCFEECLVEDVTRLLAAERCVGLDPDLLNPDTPSKDKKDKLKQFLATTSGKVGVTKDGFAGYAAVAINRQSLFVNRVATKLKNRSADVLQKMWSPFKKLDNTCIQRFGDLYTVPRGVIKNTLGNSGWMIGNSIVRTVAFSQAGTPWGWACIAGYGAYSVGTTAYRMWRNYEKQKETDKNMTAGKYFKQNWSGMLLGAVGTALAVVPGLEAAGQSMGSVMDTLRDSGALSTTNIPFLDKLGMTNASVGLIAAGLVDSTVRGTKAYLKSGDGFFKAMGKALGGAAFSSALGVGTGMACAYGANSLLDNMGFNLAGDVRTPEVRDGSFDPNNPNHYSEAINFEEIEAKLSGDDLAKFQQLEKEVAAGNLSEAEVKAHYQNMEAICKEHGISMEHVDTTVEKVEEGLSAADKEKFQGLLASASDTNHTQAESQQAMQELNKFCNEHHISIEQNEKGEISVSYSETVSEISAEAVQKSKDAVEMWTKDAPEVREANLEILQKAVNEYNEAHPEQPADVYRVYRTMLEMGNHAVDAKIDTNQQINHLGEVSSARGLHTLVSKYYLNMAVNDPEVQAGQDHVVTIGEYLGLNAEQLNEISHIADAKGNFDAAKLTPDTLAQIINVEHHMAADGSMPPVKEVHEFSIGKEYLPSNTEMQDGVLHNTGGTEKPGTEFNSWNKHESPYETTTTTHTEHFKPVEHPVSQWYEKMYMPLNQAIDLFHTATRKIGLSKIMGNNGKENGPSRNATKPLQRMSVTGGRP